MTTATLQFSSADDGEELARAEVYGLLAALFHAPMSDELFGHFKVAVTVAPVEGAFLEHSWGELVGAARRIGLSGTRDEYEVLFQGVGRPEIFLYGSYHAAGKLNEKPLVDLRHALRELGLERPPAVVETEDHIAFLCEVMRFLIAGEDVAVSNLTAQRAFFDAHLRGWNARLFDQIAGHPAADFYAAVAAFARDFFAVEAQGFDLLDGA